jgi:hypothetical protein
MNIALIVLLFSAFALFASGGVYMGITYWKEAVAIAKIASTTEHNQLYLHSRGIANASFIAAWAVLLFGAVVCAIIWQILNLLDQILKAVAQ